MVKRGLLALDGVEQHLGGQATFTAQRLGYGGQGRVDQRRQGDIIETGDGKLVRQSDALILGCSHGPDGDNIAHGDDRRGPGLGFPQVTEVFPSLAEVTLITDKDHEVPVQVLRNGDRTILFGSGSSNEVELRYMPVAADIKVGDLLVTSGIGGTYPAGLPVAKVARVERDPDYPFAHVICTPVAGVSRNHWLFILSGKTNLPSRPEHPDENASAKSRKKPK